MSVLDLAEARAYLRIQGASADTDIEQFIGFAEAAVAARVGPLESIARTDRIRGGGSRTLVLPGLPVVSVTTVTGSSGTVVTPDWVSLPSGVVYGSFPDDYYDVVYVSGRATVPDDLRMALLAVLEHMWATQRGPAQQRGADMQPQGAAYLWTYRIEQLLAPHLPVGIA